MFKTIPNLSLRLSAFYEKVNITSCRYAGHSKWQNIRHIKAAKDTAKSALFTRLGRQIKVAIQEGGSSDPKKNLQLENMIEQCKRVSMPSATIQSVIKSCESDKSNSKPHMIEIKGAGGCIILCEVFTGNLHQLRQNISTLLRKNKGKYTDGGGSHLFDQKGIIEVSINSTESQENLIEVATDHAIEAGAEDVKTLETGTALQFVCGASNLKKVVTALEGFNYKITSASIEYIPLKFQELSDEDLQLCSNLCEKLEAMPEVVKLSDNIA